VNHFRQGLNLTAAPGAFDTSFAPGSVSPMASYTEPLLPGDAGVEQTVQKIFEAWRKAYQDPVVNMLALQIVHGTPVNDRVRAECLFNWVRDNITFVDDPPGHETVRDARFTIEAGAGDCDCIGGVFLPSLAGCVGIPGRLVTIAVDPRRPGEFSHIYAELFIEGCWLCVDTARSNPTFGQAIPASRHLRPAQIWEPDFGDSQIGVAGYPPGQNDMAGFFSTVPASQLAGPYQADFAPGLHGAFGLGQDPGDYSSPSDFLLANPDEAVYDSSTDTTVTLNAAGQFVTSPGLPTDGTNVVSMDAWGGGGSSSGITPTAASQATGLNIPANSSGAPNLGGFTAAQITAMISAGGTASAAIVKALNTPYATLPPGFSLNAFGQVVGPTGQVISSGSFNLGGLSISPTVMVLVIAVAAAVMLKSR
jgi:hypothetical protein